MASPVPTRPDLRRRVLLVESDTDTRDLYEQALALSGWEIEKAEDGRDALVKAFAARPHAIVTETRLPFIDGYALCRLLRGAKETAGLPILVLTGDVLPEQIQLAREAGADLVLTKPCLPDALAAAIRRLTDSGAAPDAASAGAASNPAGHATADPPRRSSPRPPSLARTHQRYQTATPPLAPPALLCPICDAPLQYERSHVGGVSGRHPEQWDDYVCPRSCGAFQYRHRTRKLRRTGGSGPQLLKRARN